MESVTQFWIDQQKRFEAKNNAKQASVYIFVKLQKRA